MSTAEFNWTPDKSKEAAHSLQARFDFPVESAVKTRQKAARCRQVLLALGCRYAARTVALATVPVGAAVLGGHAGTQRRQQPVLGIYGSYSCTTRIPRTVRIMQCHSQAEPAAEKPQQRSM